MVVPQGLLHLPFNTFGAMQKPLILALLGYGIFIGSIAAQNTENPSEITIESNRNQTIYVGVDNLIKVVCPGLTIAEYVVTTDKGTIIRTNNELFKLKPTSTGQVTVQVWVKGKVKQKKVFQAVPVPDPKPLLGSFQKTSDTVQLGMFKAMAGIWLHTESPELKDKCEVVSFRITQIGADFTDGKMFTKSLKNTGAKFDSDAQKLISEAAPGDVYIFDEIKVKCPGDTAERELTPMVYYMETYKD